MRSITKTIRLEPELHKMIEREADSRGFKLGTFIYHLLVRGLTGYLDRDEIIRCITKKEPKHEN